MIRKETSTNFENEQLILGSCAIAYTLSLIGGRWKPTILWQLAAQPMRYTQLAEVIPNITDRMLTLSLKELEKAGLISRKTYAGFPVKVEYRLTSLGQSMKPLLKEISDWGSKNKLAD